MKYGRGQLFAAPNQLAVKMKIKDMFATEKQKMKDLLQAAPGNISIVVNCGTIRNGYCFYEILATFNDDNWKFQQVLLDFDLLHTKGKHSSEVFGCHLLQNLHFEHKFQEKRPADEMFGP
ncbi:unnamed protein product [Allacma fusca]|uniref:Uncharacterized protein n=1 Tax=Allacma fusca TaxID=39272 RepID=A0A8J2PKH4_9HEXA|nr:unnamed protein product [Allacma fusca]